MTYTEFLETKIIKTTSSGFDVDLNKINDKLFDWQKVIVRWALKKGKAAIFADCGLGKTFMQLEWATRIHKRFTGKVLILAPLAVSLQTKREGEKLGVEVNICRTQEDVKDGINITNYEMLSHFEASEFIGVVIDESSILKSFSGKIKQEIIDKFSTTPYKLACTATPAPNDFMELGNHSEFLNIMSRSEMLATYFIHDSGDTSKWRLKGHATNKFWEWISGWAAVIKSPADLGFNSSEYILPELIIHEHLIESEPDKDCLYVKPAQTLTERREASKESLDSRINMAAELVNKSDDTFLVWCNFNDESEGLTRAIKDAIEVTGSNKPEHKEHSMLKFASGEIKCLVTKPKIAGFGMNWQICSNMIFCGLSDSYEQFYQAIRRCWRFGQKKAVNVHVIISEKEISVLENIKRKEREAETMTNAIRKLTNKFLKEEISATSRITEEYRPQIPFRLPDWLVAS